MMEADKNASKSVPGPKPERVKSDKDWEEAMKDALKKNRPEGGWPVPKKKKAEN